MITARDILPIEEFVRKRDIFARDANAAAALRRIAVGPNITLIFENRLSVWWQIQEMCRVEGIRSPAGVQHEIDTYNELLPARHELSATLLVEYPNAEEREVMVRRLVGLHHHLWIDIDGQRSPARFDKEQFSEERVSTVQFVRFPLPDRRAFLDLSRPAAFEADHPVYAARTSLSATTRGALAEDLDAATG